MFLFLFCSGILFPQEPLRPARSDRPPLLPSQEHGSDPALGARLRGGGGAVRGIRIQSAQLRRRDGGHGDGRGRGRCRRRLRLGSGRGQGGGRGVHAGLHAIAGPEIAGAEDVAGRERGRVQLHPGGDCSPRAGGTVLAGPPPALLGVLSVLGRKRIHALVRRGHPCGGRFRGRQDSQDHDDGPRADPAPPDGLGKRTRDLGSLFV